MTPSKGTWARFLDEHLARRVMQSAELASAVGLDRGVVSRWRSGQRVPTDPAVLRAVSRALNTDMTSTLIAAGYLTADDVAGHVIEKPISDLPDNELHRELRRRRDEEHIATPPPGETIPDLLELAAYLHAGASGRTLAQIAASDGYEVSHASLYKFRNGTTPVATASIEAIAYLAGVSTERANEAATRRPVEAPFADELPAGVNNLSRKERAAAVGVLAAMIDARNTINQTRQKGR